MLSKPLGTQLGVNLRHWSKRPTRFYEDFIKGHMTQAEIDALYDLAVASMSRLNTAGARMMRKHGCHGCTDVTGFGLLGHARNLASAQLSAPMQIVIDALPLLAGAAKGDTLLRGHYKLLQGLSAETSGGLLMAYDSAETAAAVVAELAAAGEAAWIVGRVAPRDLAKNEPSARISESCVTIEVSQL